MKNEVRLFMVDPMSYNNLSLYDKLLLDNLSVKNKYFFCNTRFEYKESKGLNSRYIYSYSEKKGLLKPISYVFSQIALLFYIFIKRPNTIHFQWLKLPVFDYILLRFIYLFFRKVEIVFTAHNILPHDSGDKYKNIFRKIYTKVHKIIVHDQSTKDEISTVFGIEENKIFVVPHGILSIENKRETKVKHNETIVFSMLGHLNKYKGVDLLIDAWLTSDQLQFSKCKLILAGKASQEIKESLKKLNAIENVKIIDDFLSEEEFENILAITDVLVLPYTKISQSGLMLTAFGYRIPVLVSAIGGLTQPFKIGKVGWILDEISSNDLQNKMYYILKKPTELKLIRKDTELWKKVETFYSWERIGQITSKVYTS